MEASNELVGPSGSGLRWNGWGYADTEFTVTDKNELMLSGHRYELSGTPLPSFRPWVEDKMGLDLNVSDPPLPLHSVLPSVPLPDSIVIQWLRSLSLSRSHLDHAKADADGGQPSSSNLPPSSVAIKHSVDPVTRIHHSHGHTCREVWQLRKGLLPRVADAVVWPLTEDAVADVVAAAAAADVVLMPYGGGTSVTNALTLPERDAEPRPIVVVSMAKLNAVLDVDTVNMTATIQAGAVGAVLGKELADGWGVTMGHEPDSYEFSTLGGWIATRASGMQKNVYGNIEDIVISVTLVTPTGTVVKDAVVPRISAGPDIHHLVLGSEGTLGIITSAIVKVRPLPAVRKYGALIFPDFDAGVAAMYDIAQAHAAPASIRLVDNNQFQMGQALKPPTSWFASAIAAAKKFYVLSIKGFEADTMVAATLLFLGNSDADIAAQEAALYPIAARHGGMPADEENGRRGYALTFMIAYIRDLAFQYCFLAESFETSVPWSGVRHLCTSVKAAIVDAAAARSIPREPFVTCRVTQTYDTGACVYFYFAFLAVGVDNAMDKFDEIEHIARVAILDAGGSISHHHGIGKHRASFMPHVQSPAANAALRAVKRELDPTNVFASGNVLPAKL